MKFISDPKNILVNARIQFEYNGKNRSGTVERVGNTFVTLKHDDPNQFKNKTYSTYQFRRIASKIAQVD